MKAAGFSPPQTIHDGGKIHRFSTVGKLASLQFIGADRVKRFLKWGATAIADWKDVHQTDGVDAVRSAIEAALLRHPEINLAAVIRQMLEEIEQTEYDVAAAARKPVHRIVCAGHRLTEATGD